MKLWCSCTDQTLLPTQKLSALNETLPRVKRHKVMDRFISPQDLKEASSFSSFENMITILVLHITLTIISSQMKCLLKMSVKDVYIWVVYIKCWIYWCIRFGYLYFRFWKISCSCFQILSNNIPAFDLP